MSCLGQPSDVSRFDLFTSLPAELRLQIWSLNNPSSRVVPFHPTKRQRCGIRRPQDKIIPASQHLITGTACPSNLHACHESRKEALRFYHQLYEAATRGHSDFFDCARDILLFDAFQSLPSTGLQMSSFISFISPHVVRSIRNIAITEAVFSDIQATSRVRPRSVGLRTEDVLRQLCTWLPSLQHIIIVHANTSNRHDEERGVVAHGERTIHSYDGDIYLVNPPVRYRFTERRLQNALDAVAQEAGTGWARPAWSIQTLGARPSIEGSAKMARRIAEKQLQRPLPAGADSNGTNQPQVLQSTTARRTNESICHGSPPHSSSPRISQNCRTRWALADLTSTRSNILDHASSRLAFYRRHHYWG